MCGNWSFFPRQDLPGQLELTTVRLLEMEKWIITDIKLKIVPGEDSRKLDKMRVWRGEIGIWIKGEQKI